MTARKLFYGLLGGLVIVSIMVILSVYFGNQVLSKQNKRLAETKVQLANLDNVQSSLVTAKRDIEQYSVIEQIAKTVVPQEKDQAKTVREIVKIADEAGISISSISFANSTLGSTGKAKTPAASTGTSTTQTEKVEGLSGVEKLPITVVSDAAKPVSYRNFLRFLEQLEQNRRTSQVADVNIQPSADNRNFLNFSLKLNVYIKK